MADKLLAKFDHYDDILVADDILYFVDSTGPTKKKIKAQRFCVTDGNLVTFTGGGTIVLGNFALTATGSGTLVEQDTVETWTNKAFVAPTIASMTNAQHDHDAADTGGPLAVKAGDINIYKSQTGISPETTYQTWIEISDDRTCFWLNGDHIPADDTLQLVVWSHPAGKLLSFRVYNATTDAAVVGSTAVSAGSAGWEMAISTDFRAGLASGLNRYHLQIYNASSGGDDGTFAAATILIA